MDKLERIRNLTIISNQMELLKKRCEFKEGYEKEVADNEE